MTDTTQQRPRPCAWAMRIPGCDCSADWVELGEQQPAACAPAVAHPLYDHAAIDAAIEQANARQNASWRLMCERMVAAERERIAAHFDDRDRGHDGKPLGLGYYEPHEPAEIIRALGPNVRAKRGQTAAQMPDTE